MKKLIVIFSVLLSIGFIYYFNKPQIVEEKKTVYKDCEQLSVEDVKKEVVAHPEEYRKIGYFFRSCTFNDDERALQILIDSLKEAPKESEKQRRYLDGTFSDVIKLSTNLEIVKKLVGLGADVNQADFYGISLLSYALRSNPNLDIARYLIEAGADVKAKDKYGITTLGYLIGREPKVDAPDIVQKLIDGGVDVNAYDLKNPLEYAHVCGLKETEKLLIKAGAKPKDSFERLKKIGVDCKRYSQFSSSNIFSDPPSDKYVKRYWFW